jgi:hypothetical protein
MAVDADASAGQAATVFEVSTSVSCFLRNEC